MVSTVHDASPVDNTESDRLGQLVGQLHWRVTTKKDVNADLLNLVFLGSENQVKSAFREAGWHNADPVSRHTYLKNFYARRAVRIFPAYYLLLLGALVIAPILSARSATLAQQATYGPHWVYWTYLSNQIGRAHV